MDRTILEVPTGIRYISDWEEFDFGNFPDKCIINKQLPGCGFTEWCIRNRHPLVLCSPRRMLLQNKADQHPEVFLVRNELDQEIAVDEDISKDKELPKTEEMISTNPDLESKTSTNFFRIQNEMRNYIKYCQESGQPMKILVTYDSYRIVKDILSMEGLFWNFFTVIDEFQTILHDSRFKSGTELEFMSVLGQVRKTYFVSATPMLDRYLEMLDEFKDLPYLELDWGVQDPTRIIKPNLKVLSMKSVGSQAEDIIKDYKEGKFERAIRVDEETGEIKEIISNEAVLYVNSVNHIISIIKRNGLMPEEVNILCSNTDSNQKKIWKRLGKRYNIGSVPLRGIKPKMFTFCTRTVYLGADFYSLCARSFIFSDSNYDCLAVDISQDLPQILGRQRLFDNPWKNQATFYYKLTCDYRKMTKEEFESGLRKKKLESENLLSVFEKGDEKERKSLAIKYQDGAIISRYRKDYVAVNTHGGTCMKPVFNNLVYVSEVRAYDIQQVDYKDRFSVFCTINANLSQSDIANLELENFFSEYDSLGTLYDKLKYYCSFEFSDKTINEIALQQFDEQVRSYILALGKDRLKALGYNKTKIDRELGIKLFNESDLGNHIRTNFKIGDKYTLSDLKEKLRELYDSIGYKATPKASDILDYFEVKEVSFFDKKSDGSRRRIRGYEILNYKE